MPIYKKDGSIDIEATYERAITQLTISTALPSSIQGNRGAPVKIVSERELQALTRQLFNELGEQCRFYTDKTGYDVMWVSDWLKMYWSAWNGGIDLELVYATIDEDCVYKDVLSFGREMVGIQAFIDYNQAFYDAAADLSYYLHPGEIAMNVSPKGEVLLMGRYTGCGNWENPLRMYPFTPGSPAIPGTGGFITMTAVDRYHFNPKTRKVCRGETLWDPFEPLQIQNLMPSDNGLPFKAVVAAGQVLTPAIKLSRKLRGLGRA